MSRENKSGQALLIVFLAMATITTVVLSVALRSVTEVEITNLEEDSLRAFTAAEAGLEEALVTGVTEGQYLEDIQVPTGQDSAEVAISNYQTNVSGYPSNTSEFSYPFELFSGDSTAIWLVTRLNNETINDCTASTPCFSASDIRVCWGEADTSSDTAQSPAVELTFIYQNLAGDYHSTKTTFDPNSVRRGSNNFTPANTSGCTIAGEDFAFRSDIDLTSLGIPFVAGAAKMMKVRMLYNTNTPHTFGVSSSGTFPSQGRVVTSTGQSGNSTRKIEAYTVHAAPPSIFDSVLFSGVDIAK